MTAQKVPLVAYEKGVRKIIGEAVIDTDGDYIDLTAKITDENYRSKLAEGLMSGLSVGGDEVVPIEKETDVKSKKGKKSKANKPH
jgi:hypothetical protein